MSLRVDLNGSGSGFSQMLNQARAQATAFANSVEHEVTESWGGIGKSFAAGFAGMFTVEGLKSGLEWFVSTGKEIKETAEQVDMSAASWQKWSQAVEDAGMSTGGFMRVLEALRQKRTEALTDPKARGELSRLGFSDADITGNMDMDTFLKRALANASGGDLQRKYLADIIGQRGLKFATVAGRVDEQKPAFDDTALDEAQQIGHDEEQVKRALGSFAASGIDTLFLNRDRQKAFGLTAWRLLQAGLGRGTLWNKNASWKDGIYNTMHGLPQNYKPVELRNPGAAADAKARADAVLGSTAAAKDPMDAKLAAQRDELALHEQERHQRLVDSQRSLMTIGDRRASILGEMPGLQKQIAEREAKMHGDAFLTGAQKDELSGVTGKAREFMVNTFRTKFQDETDNLRLRYNRDKGDLKEKPLNFNADSMSKLGLYSASAVAFNPVLGIAQRQLSALNQIVKNTSKPPGKTHNQNDPHAP